MTTHAESSRTCRQTHFRRNLEAAADITMVEDDEMRCFVLRYTDGCRDRIKFPHSFTERFGSLIDQEIWLNTKDGYRWLTHVERHAGNIWIGDNLEWFKERYNIKVLDTLYFKHKSGNKLQVLMFNGAGLQYGWGHEPRTKALVSFLKRIVTRDYITKIVLPDQFTETYGSRLKNPVTLIARDGKKWLVHLVEHNGSIWFNNGWSNFARNYNVQKNDCLIFKFLADGDMKVRVVRNAAGLVGQFEGLGDDDVLHIDDRVREI